MFLDQCPFGADYKKRIRLLVGNVDMRDLERLSRTCSARGKQICPHCKQPHVVLQDALIRRAAEYPPLLAEVLAIVLSSTIRWV